DAQPPRRRFRGDARSGRYQDEGEERPVERDRTPGLGFRGDDGSTGLHADIGMIQAAFDESSPSIAAVSPDDAASRRQRMQTVPPSECVTSHMRPPIALYSALLVASCAHPASFVHSDTVLGRVVVYRNGVAYFERNADVVDNTLKLSVPADKVDDFLRSLTV